MRALAKLSARLPAGSVLMEPDELRRVSVDAWPLGRLRSMRAVASLPQAVALPSSTEQVAVVLAWAAETRTPVVPRGGGSGVCGGAQAGGAAVTLDLRRMDRVLGVDEASGTAQVEAGIRGDALEAALAPHRLTTGHYPQSLSISTVGGWIAASSAGQASAGYGEIEDLVLGMTAVLAGGSVVRLRAVPRSAAGPDLRRLFIGSEGTLAVITEAVLSCATLPSGFAWRAMGLSSFQSAAEVVRRVVRAEAGPTVVRAYDPIDAALTFGPLGHEEGAVALFGFGAEVPGLEDRLAAVRTLAADGGRDLPAAYGPHWWEHRNDAVGLYERIMGPERALGTGVVVDTMEVAGLWASLPGLYDGVRDALSGHAEAVGCHLSHPYRSGGSLYFTFLLRAADDEAVERAYTAAWSDAVAACHAAGGTMTHHHGVGALKAPFMARELGDAGLDVLRRIKRALDRRGVLNPGKLGLRS